VLGKFISDVSHDLRTPLTVINTQLYLLRKSLTETEHLQRLDLLEQYTGRLKRTVNDMLNLSVLDGEAQFHFAPINGNRTSTVRLK